MNTFNTLLTFYKSCCLLYTNPIVTSNIFQEKMKTVRQSIRYCMNLNTVYSLYLISSNVLTRVQNFRPLQTSKIYFVLKNGNDQIWIKQWHLSMKG